ncbi:Zinc finger protein, partial [Armadillidium vulgare]
DRPYKCTICGRAYRESGSLLRHQQSKIPCDQKSDNHLPRYGITLPFANGFKHDGELDCKLNLKKESEEESMVDPPPGDIPDSDDSKAKIRKEISRNEGFTFPNEPPTGSATPEKKPLLREAKKEIFAPDENENNIEEMDFKTLDYIKTLEEEEKILRRSFICALCHKSFTRATFLTSHLKTHLAELGSQCPTCKKNFATDHSLSRHLSSHSSVRQFECRQCGKAFKLKSHALSHLNSHSNIKTVPCPECGSLFKSVSSRNSHLKIHKGERNFECAICYKTFIAKASFLRHLKVHTKPPRGNGSVPSTSKIKIEDTTDTKHSIADWRHADLNSMEDGDCDAVETLSEGNDFSENDSELESFLNEKVRHSLSLCRFRVGVRSTIASVLYERNFEGLARHKTLLNLEYFL